MSPQEQQAMALAHKIASMTHQPEECSRGLRDHLCPLYRDALALLSPALAASAAKVEQYERESADENTCAAHPKTMLVYHCAACADALTAKLERVREVLRKTLDTTMAHLAYPLREEVRAALSPEARAKETKQ